MKYQLQIWENNPILRSISDPIDRITPEIKTFAQDLMRLMHEWDGVGLASPQVWRNIRMIAVTKWRKNKIVKDMIMINPRIVETSSHTELWEEACLSLPEIFGDVRRYTHIVVEYQDINWNHQERKFKHMDARVIQHEIDHLDGVLFIDRVEKK